jgi:hypothetical protein
MPPANDSADFEFGRSTLVTVSFEPPAPSGSTCQVIRTGPSASISGSQRGWNDITMRRPGSTSTTIPSAAIEPSG